MNREWVFYGFLIKKWSILHFVTELFESRMGILWISNHNIPSDYYFSCAQPAFGRASLPVLDIIFTFSLDFSSWYACIHEKSSNFYGFLISLDVHALCCAHNLDFSRKFGNVFEDVLDFYKFLITIHAHAPIWRYTRRKQQMIIYH